MRKLPSDSQTKIMVHLLGAQDVDFDRPSCTMDPQFVNRRGDFTDFRQYVSSALVQFYAKLGIDLERVSGHLVVVAPELASPLQLVLCEREREETPKDQRIAEMTWQRAVDQLTHWERYSLTIREMWQMALSWFVVPQLTREEYIRELSFFSRIAALIDLRLARVDVGHEPAFMRLLPSANFWRLDARGRKAFAEEVRDALRVSLLSLRHPHISYGFFVSKELQPVPFALCKDPTLRALTTTVEEELFAHLYYSTLGNGPLASFGLDLHDTPFPVLCAATTEPRTGRLVVIEPFLASGQLESLRLRLVTPEEVIKDQRLRIRPVSAP